MASYPAVIELRVDGVTQVNKVLDTIEKLDNALVSIKNTPLAIDAKNAVDGIRVLKTQVTEFAAGLSQGKTQLASTTAGINQQAAALRALAANAKIGGETFKLLTQAAEQARQKVSLTGGLAEIAAISSQVKAGRTAPMQSYKGVEELLKMEKTLPKNVASLELFQAELQNTLRYVDIGSKDFNELRAAIDRVGTSLGLAADQARKFGPALPPGFTETGVKPGTFPSSPVSGALNIPGSPRALAEARKKRGEALSNAIIGGAFPLLFGQGAGAAIGGGLGGAAGGMMGGQFGFGLSLVGTAVGQAIDTLVVKTTELGGALLKVSSTFDTLKERALISNREREKELQLLQDAGFAATANAVAQQELYKTIGVSGVESLRELGSETDRLNRTWAELSVQLQAVIAGPLADLAAKLNEFFKPIAQAGKAEALRADLSIKDRAKFDEELNRLAAKGTYKPTGQMNRPQLEALATFKPEELQKALDKFGKLRVDADVKFDPAQVRDEAVSILQKELEVLDITKKFSEAGEKQREIDKQRYDLIKDYEDSIATIRRRLEDEIESKRLSVIQKENELLDVQAQIRQESLSLVNTQAELTAGEGLSGAARDVARQAAEAAGSFIEQELVIAEQAAKLKRDAALEALQTDLEAAKFQADTAREVSRLNIDTTKKVAALNDTIRKQNAQQDTRRFEIEKQLALLRLDALKQELELLKQRNIQVRDIEALITTGTALLALKEARKTVTEARPPAALGTVTSPAMQGVSFAGLDTLNQQLKVTQERINAAQAALNDLLALKNEQDFIAKMQQIANSIDAPIQALNQELDASEKTRTRYAELINQGVRDTVAERIIEIEQLKDAAKLQYDAVITELEKKLAIEGTNQALEDQIKQLKKRKDAIDDTAPISSITDLEEADSIVRAQEAITSLKNEINNLTDPINVAVTGANAIGTAFQQAFQSLVTGTATAQESLESFFTAISEAFVSMAAEIIAKQLVMITLQTILKALGLSGGSTGTASYSSGNVSTSAFQTDTLGLGSSLSNWNWEGAGFTPFASGGFVTGPTSAVIGEGGESEYVIPASKMSAAMSRYASGARGSSVLSATGDNMTGDGGGSANTFTLETVVINNVEYATVDQVRSMGQRAASQGAQGGFSKSMRTLQNSRSQRSRLGLR